MAQPCSGRVVAIVVGAIFVVALCVPHAAALCDGGVANGQYNPAGEQCDNNNGRGCTSNCLVDSLFYCWGTPSTCVRSYAIDLVGSGTFNLTSATFPDAAALDRLRLEIANGTIGNGASIAASAITILTPSLVPGTTNVYSVPFTINFSNTNAGTVPIVTNNLRTAANSGRLTGVGNAPNYLSNCGDGIVQLGEQCDAGINNLQDGCTNTCTSVAGYNCRANLVSTTSTNGTNTPFWTCTVCGNSVLNNAGSTFLGGSSTEMCDDGNVAGIDGCSRECMVESGWSCTTNQFGLSSCTQGGTIFVCGNGVLQTGEVCDDGNSVSGDGCAGNCLAVESGFTCVTNTAGRSICSLGTSFVCGNGVIQAGEACDDGNVVSGDGCAANCLAIESGFICVTNTAGRSVCSVGTGFVCGNGVLQAGEVCDDGNVVSGDGCAGNCLAVESGFTCVTNAAGLSICSVGTGFTCGNGVVQTGEACDDGNVVSGDGCAGNCLAVEAGFTCPIVGTRSVCTLIGTGVCGNGILNTGETCDDGNLVSGDGCSSTCTTEAGFICNIVGSQSLCYLGTCGNNVVNTGEQCDDGNHVPLDGCSALCKIESGYNCIFDSALGRSVCSLFNANINRFDADDDDSDELWWVILLVILLALCLLLLLYLLCKKRKRREPEPVVMYEPKPAPLFVHPPPAIAPAVMYEVYDTY